MISYKIQRVMLISGVLFAGGLAQSAGADPVEDLENCSIIKVETERLACFDAAYDQFRAAGMTSDSILESKVIRIKVPVATPAKVSAGSPATNDGHHSQAEPKKRRFSGFGLPFLGRKKDEQPETFGKSAPSVERSNDGTVKSLSGQVTAVEKDPYGRLIITLDNGQVWKQKEGRIRAKVGDTARVRRGGMGGYFIAINNGRSVRAIRTDDGSPQGTALEISTPMPDAPAVDIAAPKAKEDKGGLLSRFGRRFGGKKKDADEETFGKTPGQSKQEREAEPKSMTSVVKSVFVDPMGNFIATLDNGSVWQQIDGRLKVREGDEVVIDKGAMGGHFFQVGDKGRSVRVRRVD
jgi:hypothetical protein